MDCTGPAGEARSRAVLSIAIALVSAGCGGGVRWAAPEPPECDPSTHAEEGGEPERLDNRTDDDCDGLVNEWDPREGGHVRLVQEQVQRPSPVGDVDADGREDLLVRWCESADPGCDWSTQLVLGSELDVGTDLFLDAPEPLAGVGGLATRVVGDLDGDGVSELVGDCLLWSDQWVHGDVQACEYQPVLSTDWGLFPVHHDDVDGDDRDDLVLVARGWPADSAEVAHNSLAFVAGASVGRGQPLELTEPDTVVLGNEPGVYFGWGAALGDADGDGLGDVAIESEDAYGAGPSTGWVVWGKDLAWGDTQAIEDAAVRLPWHGTRLWMTPAGDVNCDGYADLLAHDSDVRDGVWGFKGAVDADATWDLADPDFQLIHGFELLEPIRVGDQDGDGCDDLVVTRTGRDWGPRVITRVPSTGTYDVDAVATLTMWQGDTWHVASMGDLDGDGADDLYFRTDTHDRTASLLLSLPPDW